MLPTYLIKSAAIHKFTQTNNIQKVEFIWVLYGFWNYWRKG
jgi:hypothetical protein